MIKQKTGICTDCGDGKTKPITAGRCQFHYKKYRAEVNAWKKEKREQMNDFIQSYKKPKPIPKVSEKRKKEQKEYTIKRLQFLAQPENLRCFIDGCNNRATQVEHRAGRWGENYLDTSTWAAVCGFHNLELERNTELSQKYQLSKITGKPKLIKQNAEDR